MRNFYMLVIIIVLSISLIKDASAMRCKGKLIRVGDTSYKMLKHCGKPLFVQTDIWKSHQLFVYKMNGRVQKILVIDSIIKEGV